ncbi:hypothetical protein Tco_0924925 [Tanacetum coccineum]|uniref:Helitron helicase-like domain-containing protein n=1 Tax=Tanacetum coccineum TaxID=301880 RepID=A0ABQ5D5C3_9ASTR
MVLFATSVLDSQICIQVLWLLRDAQLYLDVFQRYSRYSVGKQKVDCSATPRASGMGSGKWKSKTDEDTDVFQAYDVLCSRNVRRRCSVGSSQSSNVFQRYTELCATRSSSTLHQTVTDVGCRVSRPVSVGSAFRNTQYAVVGGSPLPKNRKRIAADLHLTPVLSPATTSKRSRYSFVSNLGPSTRFLDQPPSTRPCVDSEPCSNQPSYIRPRVNAHASSSVVHTGISVFDMLPYICLFRFRRLQSALSSLWGIFLIHMQLERDPLDYIKNLLQNKHFMENIRAYNQLFAMTSFGAKIDESINAGRGPYVFKVSGQIYHWIGSLCPPMGEAPRFLQIYIYDTDNEVENRMRYFGGVDNSHLDTQIVEGLIQFLDAHNELIQLFRTTRDKCRQMDIPEFKIRLYNAEGARGYELPTSNTLGAMVFENGITTNKEFDVIIQHKDGPPQRINKLHQSYMSLQFPLLFIYGQPGYHTELKLRSADGGEKAKRMTMLA